MKIVVVVLLLLVSSVSVQAQTDQSRPQQIPFTRVERIGEATARSFFVFSTSIRNYAIRHDGHSEGASLTTRRKNFDLRMGGAARLERLYFAEYEGDLLLEYEVTDARGDWGYLLRMEQKEMKFRWIAPLSVYNLGPGLIEGREVYLSAANLLAKIDLQTGTYLWQQSQFEYFSAFGLPVVNGDTIVFTDDVETSKIIEVEKNTGRILKH